jgi:PTH1 family peptidyl-tRNA hydrolase
MTELVVGLGNPGEKYKNTRHNIGFKVIDELARQIVDGKWQTVRKFNSLIVNHQPSAIFVKPQTFMNASGIPVKNLAAFYKIKTSDIWVLHDDLDIRLGDYKIQKGVGPKLHYGIASIEENLGASDFWRVRIGVDNRGQANRIPGEEYVLQNFSQEEISLLSKVIDQVVSELALQIEKNGK